MPAPIWHGTLEGVELADGRYLALPRVALGSIKGFGLVTSIDRASLLRGLFFKAPAGGDESPIRAVFYLRRRRGAYPGWRWRHEVKATSLIDGGAGPVFRSTDRSLAARVCARPAGDFICEG